MMRLQMHRAPSLGLARIAGHGLALRRRYVRAVIVRVAKLLHQKGAALKNALHLLKALPGLLCFNAKIQPWPGSIKQLVVQLV